MILSFNQEKATLCIKNKTIKSLEQRTDLLAFSRTNTVDSHIVFKKKKRHMRGALLNKDWTASFKQATEKNSEYNFTFILR